METIYVIFAAIAIAFAILPIILFFKVWRMTNDVKEIAYILRYSSRTFATTPTRNGSAPAAARDQNPDTAQKRSPDIV